MINHISSAFKYSKSFCKLSNFGFRKLSFSHPFNAKVTLIGACGGIGSNLALLLKYNPLVLNLSIFDIKNTEGIGLDLSHIDTSTKVEAYHGISLKKALSGTDLIVIAAGVPRKPGMTRADLLKVNASIVNSSLLAYDWKNAMPKIAIITNPINSIVPIVYKAIINYGGSEKLLCNRLFGITTLDCVRASTFYADYLGKDPREVVVPVIGGHSEKTMVPLFSHSNFPLDDEEAAMDLTKKVREAGTKVVEAKNGEGSATLSMAYAANRFINSLLEAHYGKQTIECTYMYSKVAKEVDYFAEMAVLDSHGVKDTVPFDKMSDYEKNLLEEAIPILKEEIEAGYDAFRQIDVKDI